MVKELYYIGDGLGLRGVNILRMIIYNVHHKDKCHRLGEFY